MDYAHSHPTNHHTADSSGMSDAANLEHHIHCLEIEAYSSMLKAFIAQSDFLTWGKEGLLTELRKELNIADSEHREILTKTNSDESIRRIREQRKRASHSHAHGYVKANTSARPSASNENSIVNGNAEKPKEMFNYDIQLPHIGRGSVPKGNYQFKQQYCQPSECPTLNNRDNLIQIRAADRVIHDVEKMLYGKEKPSPVDIENAKQALLEQERAILEALGKLGKLGDVLDRDERILRNLQSRARNDAGPW